MTNRYKKSYNFYADPGHGWLKVTKDEIRELGIADQISTCSYERDKHVYLEEDCDVTVFINAKVAKHGEQFKNELKLRGHTAADRQSRIRRYNSYSKYCVEGV